MDYIVKRRIKGLDAIKVMAGARMEQRLLLMLYKALVLSVLDYGLGLIVIIKKSQLLKFERLCGLNLVAPE